MFNVMPHVLIAIVIVASADIASGCHLCRSGNRPATDTVELHLQLALSQPEPGRPARTILVGTVANGLAEAISLDTWPGRDVQVFALQQYEGRHAPATTHGPRTFRLYSSADGEADNVRVATGSTSQIFSLNLSEILGEGSGNRESVWRWDWPSRMRPPASLLLPERRGSADIGSLESISMWFEISVDGSVVQSNLLTIPVIPNS